MSISELRLQKARSSGQPRPGVVAAPRCNLTQTVVGKGTKIGNVVVIGHNCRIGPHNMIISQVGIAGSTTTGQYVVMAGQVGVNGHLDIPDNVRIGAQAGVLNNPQPNTEILGTPAMEASQAKRVILSTMHLPDLIKRVRELEKQLQWCEKEI